MTLFLSLLTPELQVLGSGFVFGFIQAVDQERDPRNLLIIFSIVPIVSKYFKLEPFTEELFEVFSCYFPIDFTAVDCISFISFASQFFYFTFLL